MTAVVLAGGRGTRMRHINGDLPKVMVHVAGRPFLDWLVDELWADGINEVRVCAAPGGTGGAVKACLDELPDQFFVLNGDTYFHCDYRKVEPMSMLVMPSRDGNATRKHGVIVNYRKGWTNGNCIDCGGYYTKEMFDVPDTEFDMELVILNSLGKLKAHPIDGRFYEVGSPEGLERTRRYFGYVLH